MSINDLSLYICFFVKQKTAYEMRISDWSSDVCSSDLCCQFNLFGQGADKSYRRAWQFMAPRGRSPRQRRIGRPAVTYDGREQILERHRRLASQRSEERRVGQGRVRPCRLRWSP